MTIQLSTLLTNTSTSETAATITTKLESTPLVLDYTQSTPWWWTGVAGSDDVRASMTINRLADYTGGGVNSFGNRCGGNALQVITTTNSTHTNAEYAFSAHVVSNSVIDPAAITIGQAWPQNVAVFGGAYQMPAATAPLWAANFSAQNKSGTAQVAGRGAVIGIEVNVGISGVDNFNSSVGIQFTAQPMDGISCTAWNAAWVTHGANNGWKNAFYTNSGSVSSFYSDATGTRGLHLAGSYGVAIDTSTATNSSGTALRIKSGDRIAFDTNDQFNMKYNSATGFLEFWNNAGRKGYIDLTSGADGAFTPNAVTVAGGTQTITGPKIFSQNTEFPAVNITGSTKLVGALATTMTGCSNLGGANAVSLSNTALNIEQICTSGYIASLLSATPTNGQVETVLRPLYAIVSCLLDELKDRKVL